MRTSFRTTVKIYARAPLSFSRNYSQKLKDIHVPVVIVGGGPVGLSCSALLSKLGVQSLLVEKRDSFTTHPQAHFINNRTMEIFRQLDGLNSQIAASQPPLDEWRSFHYCLSMIGPSLGTVDHFRGQELNENGWSPVSLAHFSQNKLLPLLYDTALRLHQKSFPQRQSIEPRPLPDPALPPILMGHECVGLEPHPEGVSLSVCDNRGPATLRLHSSFLVAADGARSWVRGRAGVQMEGQGAIQSLVNIHFRSLELGEVLLARKRAGMLYFVFNSDVVAVVVAHDLARGDFVAQVPFFPPQQKLEDFTPDYCRSVISKMSGIANISVNVLEVRQWTMTAQVAESFDVDRRIFLVGDAAHSFPPAGGFGMNSGIQDAHNLAWKLASVLAGVSQAGLLGTYGTERRAAAWANTNLSLRNFEAAISVPKALGLDPEAARVLQRLVNLPPVSLLPMTAQRVILEAGLTAGRSQLSPLFLNKHNPIGHLRIQAVNKILADGDSLQLQFPNEDLGFRYVEGALVNESQPPGDASPPGRARKKEYIASSAPGSRLPHHWMLEIRGRGASCHVGARVSTLDWFPMDSCFLSLVVGCNDDGRKWCRDTAAIANEEGIKVNVFLVKPRGLEFEMEDFCGRSFLDESEDWWEKCALGPESAILVRPDGYVAWRSERHICGKSLEDLRHAIRCVLFLDM